MRFSVFFAPVLLAAVSLTFAPHDAWAGGRREVHTFNAGADETWQHTFDVSEWSTGTHNVIVHARDRAGNESVSGPFNLRVDPDAALPVVRVVYPAEGDIIRQDISVLGIASGRYGLSRVLIRLNDEDEIVASGTDYWYRFMDMSRIPDGRHVLSVRAFDEGGLYGPEHRVNFILDTTPPLVEITSHRIGDIVSGNFTVRGRVSDANGVRVLQHSENGIDFRPLSTRGGRRVEALEFSFPVRTRDLSDGPMVHFLRAVDNTGLVSVVPVLFFVSNAPPDLEILGPLPGEPLFNTFMLSGRAHSPVGIASLEYQWGRIQGEIEVRPGDPYWNVVLEQGPGSGNSVTVTVTDNAGNRTRLTQRLEDRRRDMVPVIVIDYPPPEALENMPMGTAIFGRVEGGFGPSRVVIGNNVDSVEAFPSFRIDPSQIPFGRRVNLRIAAEDSGGFRGAAAALRITRTDEALQEGFFPVESRLTVNSPEPGGWVAGGFFTLAGSADPGTRVQFRLSPQAGWQTLTLDEFGDFSTQVQLTGPAQGPVHLELRTGDNFPLYHPFNRVATTAPQVRFVSPSTETDPDRPPRLVSGNRTVVVEAAHPAPIVGVAYSLDGYSFTDIPFASCVGRVWFSYFCNFTVLDATDGRLVFRLLDAAGSSFEVSPSYVMNPNPPIPVIIVNSPVNSQLFTTPFTISGIAYDEVGIGSVHWRILGPKPESISAGEAGDAARLRAQAFVENPDVEFTKVLTDRNFSIPIDFSMITDGEYTLEIFASDMYGVPSEIASRTIRISTDAPSTRVTAPLLTRFYNRTISVRGFSADANGVARVSLSMDGGNTWQDATLEEDGYWEIPLNTAIYSDGVYAGLIRAVDNYGVTSFTSAMVNIDNSHPDLHLTFPGNGQNVGADLQIMGRVFDNTGLDTLTFQVISASDPDFRLEFERNHSGGVIFEEASLAGFPPGEYVVRVIARDLAGNESVVSREVIFGGADAQIAIFNPFPGETHSDAIQVVGSVTGSSVPDTVRLMIGDLSLGDVAVDRFGIFRHIIVESLLRDGQPHDIFAYYYTDVGERVSSPVHTVFYSRFGPVLTIDSHRDGDIITRRPWLSGRAWVSCVEIDEWDRMHDAEDDIEAAARRERRRLERGVALTGVQVSYDNGHTFRDARGGRDGSDWRFRMETGELPVGPLPVVVRAQFANGEEAVRRVMLYVDTTAPMVQTLAHTEGNAFRAAVPVYGIAGVVSENNDLASVDVSLRTGDKMLYSVPAFLQGAFIDLKFLGATFFDVGVGLSFFDDNVRFQAQFGIAPSYGQYSMFVGGGRYTGNVFGVRLLANIFNLPFSWILGPDWAFFSMNIAVGANFSWFSMADEHERSSLFMSAVVGQFDIANVNMQELFPEWRFFRNFALYLQPELWFASSDVRGETIFRMTFGLRTNIF